MYFLLVVALLSTLIYLHLMVVAVVNAKINPYGGKKDDETTVLITKIKYGLLVIMALSWSAVIRFW